MLGLINLAQSLKSETSLVVKLGAAFKTNCLVIVADGLAEEDVSVFVQELKSQHHEAEERLAHIDSLHELATRTLHEAQTLAEDMLEEARKEADESAAQIIAKATERAQQIIEAAEEAKTESEREAASAMVLAEKRATELILGAKASAERRLLDVKSDTDPQDRGRTTLEGQSAEPANFPGSGGGKGFGAAPQQPSTGVSSGANTLKKARPVFRWSPGQLGTVCTFSARPT